MVSVLDAFPGMRADISAISEGFMVGSWLYSQASDSLGVGFASNFSALLRYFHMGSSEIIMCEVTSLVDAAIATAQIAGIVHTHDSMTVTKLLGIIAGWDSSSLEYAVGHGCEFFKVNVQAGQTLYVPGGFVCIEKPIGDSKSIHIGMRKNMFSTQMIK